MKFWVKAISAFFGGGAIIGGSFAGIYIYSKSTEAKGESHFGERSLDNDLTKFRNAKEYVLTLRDPKNAQLKIANYDYDTDTITGKLRVMDPKTKIEKLVTVKKKAQDWIETYYEQNKIPPVFFVEGGPILFSNFYTDVILPKDYVDFVQWYVHNVPWTPGFTAISYYMLKRGIEKKYNSYVLGSYTAEKGERKVIKFIPDSFFRSAKLSSGIVWRYTRHTFTKFEVKELVKRMNTVNKNLLQDLNLKVPVTNVAKRRTYFNSIYSAEKIGEDQYVVYMDMLGSTPKGPVLNMLDKYMYDLKKEVSDIDIVVDKNGMMSVVDQKSYKLPSNLDLPWLELLRAVGKANGTWKGLSTTFLKYVSSHEYGHMQTLAVARRADKQPIQLGTSNLVSPAILGSPTDLDVINLFLAARAPHIRAIRVKPELKYSEKDGKYHFDEYNDALQEYEQKLEEHKKDKNVKVPEKPVIERYTNIAFEILDDDKNTWTREEIDQIFAGKVDVKDPASTPNTMKNINLSKFWAQRYKYRFFSRDIKDIEAFAQKVNLSVYEVTLMNSFDNFIDTVNPTYVSSDPDTVTPKMFNPDSTGKKWSKYEEYFYSLKTDEGKPYLRKLGPDELQLSNKFYHENPNETYPEDSEQKVTYEILVDNFRKDQNPMIAASQFDAFLSLIDQVITSDMFASNGRSELFKKDLESFKEYLKEMGPPISWFSTTANYDDWFFNADKHKFVEVMNDINAVSEIQAPSQNINMTKTITINDGKSFMDYIKSNNLEAKKYFTGNEPAYKTSMDLLGKIAVEIINGNRVFAGPGIFGDIKKTSYTTKNTFSRELINSFSSANYMPKSSEIPSWAPSLKEANFLKLFYMFNDNLSSAYFKMFDENDVLLKSNIEYSNSKIEDWKKEIQNLGIPALPEESQLTQYKAAVVDYLISKAKKLEINFDADKIEDFDGKINADAKRRNFDIKSFERFAKKFTFTDLIDLMVLDFNDYDIKSNITVPSLTKDTKWSFAAKNNLDKYIDPASPDDVKTAFKVFASKYITVAFKDKALTGSEEFKNIYEKMYKNIFGYIGSKALREFLPFDNFNEYYKVRRDVDKAKTDEDKSKAEGAVELFLKAQWSQINQPWYEQTNDENALFSPKTYGMLSFIYNKYSVAFGDYAVKVENDTLNMYSIKLSDGALLKQYLASPHNEQPAAIVANLFSIYTDNFAEVLTRDWVQSTFTFGKLADFRYSLNSSPLNRKKAGFSYYVNLSTLTTPDFMPIFFVNEQYDKWKASKPALSTLGTFEYTYFAVAKYFHKKLIEEVNKSENLKKIYDDGWFYDVNIPSISDEVLQGFFTFEGSRTLLYKIRVQPKISQHFLLNEFLTDRWYREILKGNPNKYPYSQGPKNFDIYDDFGNEVVDESIRIKDLQGKRVTTRARAYWMYILRSYGIGDRTITAMWREPTRDAFTMWGYLPKTIAPKIKYLKFKKTTGEIKYIPISIDVDNLFYLKKQGDPNSKVFLKDEGFTSWVTKKYISMGTWYNSNLSNGEWEITFVDDKLKPVNYDNHNAFWMGKEKIISEEFKNSKYAPCQIIQNKNGRAILKIKNQFPT